MWQCVPNYSFAKSRENPHKNNSFQHSFSPTKWLWKKIHLSHLLHNMVPINHRRGSLFFLLIFVWERKLLDTPKLWSQTFYIHELDTLKLYKCLILQMHSPPQGPHFGKWYKFVIFCMSITNHYEFDHPRPISIVWSWSVALNWSFISSTTCFMVI